MAEVPPFLWADAGTFPSPKRYTVPGAGEVMPYTATATYVNASGQAILPALRIKSAEGALLSLTFPVGSTIANGASSEVTFVPPFGSAQAASTPTTTGGLPSAIMTKTNTQTVAGNSVTQITLDSGTFATTDNSIFSASGSNIVIADDGLYASWLYFQPDDFDADPALTQLYSKWLTTTGGANAPWEQIVPRLFNVNGPAGLQGFSPDGSGLAINMASIGMAYCSAQPTSVRAFLATLSAASVKLSTCMHVVVQLQPITATDLAGFPTFPL